MTVHALFGGLSVLAMWALPTFANAEICPITPEAAAARAIEVLLTNDGGALAKIVHPAEGVRFSPSAFVDLQVDQTLSADEVEALWDDPQLRVWGYEDGTGDPITLTGRDFVEAWVIEAPYIDRIVRRLSAPVDRGTTVDNSAEHYPEAVIIEVYDDGAPQDATDWRALRFAVAQDGPCWALVGVVSDRWSP